MRNNMVQRFTKIFGFAACISFSGLLHAQPFDWSSVGPFYNAGRARNIVVDRLNPDILYVGSASSGIFKSINAGAKWSPVNDQAAVRNISYLAQSADGTIYAATGEGFLRTGQKAKAQPGTGLYKLNQSTLEIVVSSSVVGTAINRVACSPVSANVIALATNKGVFVSTNGTSFSSVTLPGAPTGTAVSGQDVKFNANGVLYCSIGTESGNSNAATASKVYKSSDASLTNFTDITPNSPSLVDNFYGRIELAIAPSNSNVIYASCANKYLTSNSATLKGLFVSYNGGGPNASDWGLVLQGSPQLDPLSNGGTQASGDYAHAITVDPQEPNAIFIAGYRLNAFVRTGGSDANPIGTWSSIGQSFLNTIQNYLHQNIHDIKMIGSYNTPGSKIYFVTDAGIYRTVDGALSFQPFYKGLVTGQYNSVGIERFPLSSETGNESNGTVINPYTGFIGGTGGNGMTYFSGRDTNVTKEYSYIGGEIYNVEYSKILSNAALASRGSGELYRSTDVRSSNPTWVNINSYSGGLSVIAPNPSGFTNSGVTNGTPFRLWENYGQLKRSPDSVVFYNDTLRFNAAMVDVAELTTKSTFTFAASRPNVYAKIDSIVVRTGTVQLPLDGTYKDCQTPFTTQDRQTITVKLANNYTTPSSVTAISSSNTTGPIQGPATFTLNKVTLLDDISITFTAPPFSTKTITQYPTTASGTNIIVNNPATYYRVFATVFYKYESGSELTVIDNNISTITNSYTTVYTGTNPIRWAYGTLPSYTISGTTSTAVPNPTYILLPDNISSSNPIFTVTPTIPAGVNSYTIRTQGTNTLNAIPVEYTLAAVSNSAISNPTYFLYPDNISQSNPTFVVTPSVATIYTITEVGTGTLTQDTQFTVNATEYSINNSTVTQTSPIFIVTPTVNTTYTLTGISSNTLLGNNTNTTYATKAFAVTYTVGETSVPMCPNNKVLKMPTRTSARLACILSNNGITGTGNTAIVVAKNPLALNDPLNFVRVSQSGAYTDDNAGNPTTNTISIPGKPILLEWSNSGTELYYATSDNKVYRVSHITDIMDLSPSSYSGKFYTDVFQYSSPVNSTKLNPNSPYRTTLIGAFDKPITSISVKKDLDTVNTDKYIAITFNGASTGTTGTIVYNSNDVRKSDITNINWLNKEGSGLQKVVTYCSMMERSDAKKVFVGSDNGIYYTSDITSTSPNWTNVNNNQLPSVQVFDIRQQLLNGDASYNSGEIYVATYGRGVWINRAFYTPYAVGIDEEKINPSIGKNLTLYPNPTNGNVNVLFNGKEGETASVMIYDLSGRLVKSEQIGKLNSSESINYSFDTADLRSGVYLVSINSDSGTKRVSKLIVTK